MYAAAALHLTRIVHLWYFVCSSTFNKLEQWGGRESTFSLCYFIMCTCQIKLFGQCILYGGRLKILVKLRKAQILCPCLVSCALFSCFWSCEFEHSDLVFCAHDLISNCFMYITVCHWETCFGQSSNSTLLLLAGLLSRVKLTDVNA